MRIFIIFLFIINSLSADRILKAAAELWSLTNYYQFDSNLRPILQGIHNDLNLINVFRAIRERRFLDNFSDFEKCFEDIIHIIKSTQINALESLKWIDSSAKVPTGLMGGAMSWNGNAAECLNNYWIGQNKSTSRQIVPQYCVSKISIPPEPRILSIKIGYCVPKNCDQNHLIGIINSLLKENFPNSSSAISCQSRNTSHLYDLWFIIALTVCIFLAIFISAATFWDTFIYLKWKCIAKESECFNGSNSLPMDANLEVDYHEIENDMATLLPREINMITFMEYRCQYVASHKNSRNLLAFSIIENTRKLFNVRSSSKVSRGALTSLTCLHGIRSITMLWIVLGHVVVMSLLYSNNPLFYLMEQSQKWTFQAMVGATVSVDTFFFMSGLLTSFFTLPKFLSCSSFKKIATFWIIFVIRRFLRLTPLFLFVTVLYVGIYPNLTSGQVKLAVTDLDMDACRDHWWVSYLNNFFYEENMCMAWTWYLSNEIQFSLILAPLFISLVAWKTWIGLFFLFGLISSTVVSVAYTSIKYNVQPAFLGVLSPKFPEIYFRPYNRWGPYAIGLFAGWFLLRKPTTMRKSIRRNICLSVLGFSISGVIMLAVVYGLYGVVSGSVPRLSPETSAAYNSLIRPAWAMALFIIVIFCANGLADPVNTFLSADMFIPIGRLTYAIYLVHPIVISYVLESSQQAVLMDDVFIVVYFIACLVLSSVLGYILSMAVESPLLALSNLRLNN